METRSKSGAKRTRDKVPDSDALQPSGKKPKEGEVLSEPVHKIAAEVEIQIEEEKAKSQPDRSSKEETKAEAKELPQKVGVAAPWNDGKRIFVNKLGLYDPESIKPHFLSFSDVMHPGLGKVPAGGQKIERVIFSTFVFDPEIIIALVKAKLPVCVIKDREGGFHAKLSKDSEHPNLIMVYPEKAPGLHYGVFHAKLILIQFTDFLRVVVTSANLTTVDWTLLSQVVWLQDFPKTKLSITETERQGFFAVLHDFLVHCYPKNYDPSINLYNYDFSSASADLVASISGRFHKDLMPRYGFTRLGDIVSKSGFKYPTKPVLTFQTSSVGMLKPKYLSDLYQTVIGNKKITTLLTSPEKYVQILYPTRDYIRNTVLGPEAASCIILSKRAYDADDFPKECLCQLAPVDSHPSYKGMLYHAKVGILATKQEIADDSLIYVGSHNISSSAWGKMEKGNSQICISNYELGVVFKPEKGSAEMKKTIVASLMFKYPPEPYGKDDTPWIFEDKVSDQE